MSKLIEKIDSYITEGFADDKKFDNDMQILRAAIRAELDAVTFYEQMAVKASDVNVKNLLLDVAREEKVHVGEFEEMLEILDPEAEDTEEEGAEEVETDILIKRKYTMESFMDSKQSIKKELQKIDNIISLVKKIEHEKSREGLLLKLKTMRDEIASKIGK